MSLDQQLTKEIITEHALEVSALWLLRAKSVGHHKYLLSDLAEFDKQISAHIDGLILARELAWEVCQQALQSGDAGAVFPAAALAIYVADSGELDEVINTVVSLPASIAELLAAVEWFSARQIECLFQPLLKHQAREVQWIAAQALLVHAEDPVPYLQSLINDDEQQIKISAIKLAGQLGCRDLLPNIQTLADHKDIDIQFWCAWSATLLGDRSGLNKLSDFINEDDYRDSALQLLIRSMSVQNAQLWLTDLGKKPNMARSIVIATGALGDAQNIPGLIRAMYHPEYAKIAGAAFSLITGVDLEESHLTMDATDNEAGSNTGDAEDVSVDETENESDDALPEPDPDKLAQWWAGKQLQFQPGQRYLMGLPIVDEELITVLIEGNQHQRQAAALELALRHRHHSVFNTAARASHQMTCIRKLQEGG